MGGRDVNPDDVVAAAVTSLVQEAARIERRR